MEIDFITLFITFMKRKHKKFKNLRLISRLTLHLNTII